MNFTSPLLSEAAHPRRASGRPPFCASAGEGVRLCKPTIPAGPERVRATRRKALGKRGRSLPKGGAGITPWAGTLPK
eukprot:5586560-Alexandrium_andersonii.AAC.1